ncbi:MAG: sodium:calcium antiporter [Anaerolineaceae bacterium]|nr:MAG: sodium:calcium antiporter [Anaerolineaceae bacterium]
MLYYGGDWLVMGASRLALSLGVSALVVGLTVVSFGTSMPELMVSISAVFGGTSDISVGNVIGSNIANIALILGVAGLIFPVFVHPILIRREIPILVVITIFTAFALSDGIIGQVDGIILLLGLVAFNLLMFYLAVLDRRNDNEPEASKVSTQVMVAYKEKEELREQVNRPRELGRLLVGLVVLAAGAQATVTGAVSVARTFGISELVIGVTIVAIGTSLPELATTVAAALKKQSDIALGNIVGSNVYNLLAILGVTAFLRPIPLFQTISFRPYNELLASPALIDYTTFYQVTRVDGPVMLGFTLLLIPLAFNKRIGRVEAVILLTLYVLFNAYVILR